MCPNLFFFFFFFFFYSPQQLYSFDNIAEKAQLPGGFVIGAGAASSEFVGVNAEVCSVV